MREASEDYEADSGRPSGLISFMRRRFFLER